METIRVLCTEEATGHELVPIAWVAHLIDLGISTQGLLGSTPLEVATESIVEILRSKFADSIEIKTIIDPANSIRFLVMWEEGLPLGTHEIADLGILLEIRTWFG